MHPALRENHIIKHPVIWFEHKKQLIKSTEFGSEPIPRYVNSGDNIAETIRLLGSADVIITNSYHGAFWGTLLGRKVIVVEAWSSKFNAIKHKPLFLGKGENWKDIINTAQVYNTALDECINVTEQFWNRVKERL
jgi:exopolysaccharide biosynthesis predicted pyruvyltransferase EpsI